MANKRTSRKEVATPEVAVEATTKRTILTKVSRFTVHPSFRHVLTWGGLDSIERKFGGGKIDPDKMRDTNEKITDTAREKLEGATGYVPRMYPHRGM